MMKQMEKMDKKPMRKQTDNTRRHHTLRSCLRRAGVLCLCALILITSEPGVMRALMVQAEEENEMQCVVTAFSPLPEEIAQQTVSVGTPMEELPLPDTLEAVCTYVKGQDSEDEKEEKPDGEEGQTPAKPKPDDQKPDDPTQDDGTEKEPGEGDQTPDTPETPTESGQTPDTPETPTEGDQTPDTSETPTEGGQMPGTPTEGGQTPGTPETPTEGGQTSDTPETPDTSGTPGEDGQSPDTSNASTEGTPTEGEQTPETTAGDNITPEIITPEMITEGDGTSAALAQEETAYAEKLDHMLSAARDKMLSLLDGVSVEETQIIMEAKLTELEEETELQELTNIVNINPVTWEAVSDYDGETSGAYVFTPVLPEEVLLAEGVTLPEIVVMVLPEETKLKTYAANAASVSVLAEAVTSGTCGTSLTWEYEDGILTISGSGAMNDFDVMEAPWSRYKNDIAQVCVGSGVTSIGSNAFFECASLSSIEVLGSITSIGNNAFFGCTSLGSVGLPGSLRSIGEFAFYGCSSLSGIDLPDGLTSIGKAAFLNCVSLDSVELPSSISSVARLAFGGCVGLGDVVIPASIPAGVIAAGAFMGCSNSVLYYPTALSGTLSAEDTKANIRYEMSGGGYQITLTIEEANTDAIHFPKTIGGGEVCKANWQDYYPSVKITHDGDHKYADGVCAICGNAKAPEIAIDYVNEKLTGFLTGKTYVIEGKLASLNNGTELGIDDAWFGKTISIAIQNADQSTGAPQKLEIPARPTKKPTGVTGKAVSALRNDGQLVGVNTTMEYCKKGKSPEEYQSIEKNPQGGLEAGTYYVRYKASQEKKEFHSPYVEVEVGDYQAEPEKTPEAKIDYEKECLTNLVGDASYRIGISGTEGVPMTAKSDGSISFPENESWFGKSIAIVKIGNSPDTTNIVSQLLQIKDRQKKPAGITTTSAEVGKKNGTIISSRTQDKDKLEYSEAGEKRWKQIAGTEQAGLAAGKYDVRYRASNAEEQFASESITVTISINPESMVPEATPNPKIDFINERLTGLIAGVTYKIDGEEVVAEESADAKSGGVIDLRPWISEKDSSIVIIKAGDEITTKDSDACNLPIPARPAAPEEVDTEPITAKNTSDGKLINVDNTMEYQTEEEWLAGADKWTPMKPTKNKQSGMAAGIYYIRIAATNKSFHSDEVERAVMDVELTKEATPVVAIDYEAEELTGLVAKASYLISIDEPDEGQPLAVGKDGHSTIKDEWLGKTLHIVCKGNGFSSENSEPCVLPIPVRPKGPSDVETEKASKKGSKDGKLTNVNNTMRYQKKGDTKHKDGIAITGNEVNGLEPGIYLVWYMATEQDFRSDSEEYTIEARTLEKEAVPSYAEISYREECISFLESGAWYKINGAKKAVQADADGKIPIEDAWLDKNLSIVRQGDSATTRDSESYMLPVKPIRHAKPKDIKAITESEEGAADGKLTGIKENMQWRVADDTNDREAAWNEVDGDTIEPLEPGKYKIRYDYLDGEYFASKSVTVTVYAYGKEPKKPEENKEEQEQTEEENTEEHYDAASQSDDDSSDDGSSGTSGGDAKKVTAKQADAAAAQTDETAQETGGDGGLDAAAQKTSARHTKNDGNSASDQQAGEGAAQGQNGQAGQGGDEGKLTGAVQNGTDDAGYPQTEAGSIMTAGGSIPAVYTEQVDDRMSAFYDFLLRLAGSRNLGWIAIILAEPILFLLLLIYLLGRRKRDASYQTEQ